MDCFGFCFRASIKKSKTCNELSAVTAFLTVASETASRGTTRNLSCPNTKHFMTGKAPFTLCDFLATAIRNRKSHLHYAIFLRLLFGIASLIYTAAITVRQQMRFLSVSISKVAQSQHSSHLHYAIFLRLRFQIAAIN